MDQRTPKNPFDPPGVGDAASRRKRGILRFVPGGLKTVVVGLAALFVALLVWAIKPNPNARPNNPFFAGRNQPSPVGVAKANLGDIDVTLNALGTVSPLATVTVKPQVGGQLVKIDFEEGQTIKAGQTLAEIDPRPYQATLDQAQGQLARDQAQLANAEVDLNRYQTLITQNSIAQQQVDTQAALVRQLQGTVKADQANVESARINLDYSTIKSPITGRVGLRQVDIGNVVVAGQATGIVVVTQIQPISVVFPVPEDSIDPIMARIRQGGHLSAQAFDRGQTHMIAAGMLATLDNVIDTTTGTVKLRAIFDNADNLLFANQFVNVRLLVDTLHNQIIAPVAAVQRGASGTFVYVVNPDHTVSMRTVTLGVTNDDRVAITTGLQPGDTVVVDGADRLRDGARVILPGEQGAAIATAQPGNPAAGNGGGRRGGRRGGAGAGQGAGAGARPGQGAVGGTGAGPAGARGG
jgi:multidrug efflux system membrane fusion protein